MARAGLVPDIVTYTTLLGHYGATGGVDRARELFREMRAAQHVELDSAAFNVFVGILMRAGAVEEAEQLAFVDMPAAGCRANLFTYSTLIKGRACPPGLAFFRRAAATPPQARARAQALGPGQLR